MVTLFFVYIGEVMKNKDDLEYNAAQPVCTLTDLALANVVKYLGPRDVIHLYSTCVFFGSKLHGREIEKAKKEVVYQKRWEREQSRMFCF